MPVTTRLRGKANATPTPPKAGPAQSKRGSDAATDNEGNSSDDDLSDVPSDLASDHGSDLGSEHGAGPASDHGSDLPSEQEAYSTTDSDTDMPSDHESDHSDFGTVPKAGSKKRKSMSTKAEVPKPKKQMLDFSSAEILDVPELADEDYARSEPETVQKKSDDDGLLAVGRRHNAKASVEKDEPELTMKVTDKDGAKIAISLNTASLANLLKNAGLTGLTLPAATVAECAKAVTDALTDDTTLVDATPRSFVGLPFELRSRIYKQLFKFDRPIELGQSDHCGSAAFLRTCKMAHAEGTAVLYGENSFHITRDKRTRGAYYENVWKEIAYKDILRFFKGIGPVNISHLKHLSFQLTDAADNRTHPQPGQITDARFTDDPYLQEVFRLIGSKAVLKTLALGLCGRGTVYRFDRSFVRALTEMKSYKIVTMIRFRYAKHRCEGGLMDRMKEIMWVRDDNGDRAELPEVRHPVQMVYSSPKLPAYDTIISE